MHSKGIFPVKWSIHLCLPTKVFSVYVVKWVTVEWKVLVVEEAPPKPNSESSECTKHFRECSHNEEGKGEGSRTRGRTWTVIQSQQNPQTISQVSMMAFLSCPEFRCRWAPFSERARPWAMWLSSAKGSSWRGLEAKAVSQHLRGKRLSVPKGDLTAQHGIHHRLCPRLSSRSLIQQSQPVTSNILHKPITPKCLSQAERSLLDSRRIHTTLFLDISISMGSQALEPQHVQNETPDLSPQTCSSRVASWWIAPSFIHYPTKTPRISWHLIPHSYIQSPAPNHPPSKIHLTSVHPSISMTPESILSPHLTSLLATVSSSPPIYSLYCSPSNFCKMKVW